MVMTSSETRHHVAHVPTFVLTISFFESKYIRRNVQGILVLVGAHVAGQTRTLNRKRLKPKSMQIFPVLRGWANARGKAERFILHEPRYMVMVCDSKAFARHRQKENN